MKSLRIFGFYGIFIPWKTLSVNFMKNRLKILSEVNNCGKNKEKMKSWKIGLLLPL